MLLKPPRPWYFCYSSPNKWRLSTVPGRNLLLSTSVNYRVAIFMNPIYCAFAENAIFRTCADGEVISCLPQVHLKTNFVFVNNLYMSLPCWCKEPDRLEGYGSVKAPYVLLVEILLRLTHAWPWTFVNNLIKIDASTHTWQLWIVLGRRVLHHTARHQL